MGMEPRDPAMGELFGKIDTMGGELSNVFSVITDSLATMGDSLQPFNDLASSVGDKQTEKSAKAGSKMFDKMKGAAKSAGLQVLLDALQPLIDMIAPFLDIFSMLLQMILRPLMEFFQPILEWLMNVLMELQPLFEIIGYRILGFIFQLMPAFVTIGETIIRYLPLIIDGLVFLIDLIVFIVDLIVFIIDIVVFLIDIIAWLITAIVDGLIWVFNLLVEVIRYVVNAIITVINFFIMIINGILWIFTFGQYQIPYISYLAEGGIVTNPMHAILGEKGTEAVIPLDDPRAGGLFGNDALLQEQNTKLDRLIELQEMQLLNEKRWLK